MNDNLKFFLALAVKIRANLYQRSDRFLFCINFCSFKSMFAESVQPQRRCGAYPLPGHVARAPEVHTGAFINERSWCDILVF